MCGYGTLKYLSILYERTGKDAGTLGYNNYKGTFLNNKFHGKGVQVWPEFKYIGQYKEGRRHGHSTIYTLDEKVFNMKFKEGKEVFKEQVFNPDLAWYGSGVPLI